MMVAVLSNKILLAGLFFMLLVLVACASEGAGPGPEAGAQGEESLRLERVRERGTII